MTRRRFREVVAALVLAPAWVALWTLAFAPAALAQGTAGTQGLPTVLTGRTISGNSNDLSIRTHATDCTGQTDGVAGELCVDLDDGKLWRCEPSAGACDTAGEWKRGVYIVTQSAGTSEIVAYAVNVTGGITRSCTSGVCTWSLDASVYTTDDSIVPASMTNLPTTGSWSPTGTITVNADRIQVTADADSANDPVRKSLLDTKTVGHFCIGVGEPVNGDERFGPRLWSTDPDYTITNLNCIVKASSGTPTVAVTLYECDGTGANCGTSRVNEAITCDTDGQADDGTIGNALVDGDAWLKLTVGTVGSNVTGVTLCGRLTY